VFLENVEGHLSLGYADVARTLRSMGYEPKAGLFTAREAGARHRRRRLFILAHADGKRRGLCSGPGDPAGQHHSCLSTRHLGGERGTVRVERSDAELDSPLASSQISGLDCERSKLPLFAPGPGELQAWEELLSVHPDAQPAVLRTRDGVASRMDRTRGAGNGVCSLAAALAWSTLKAAFGPGS
jgi:DNA (cytosine-5)-methyltransferase 1